MNPTLVPTALPTANPTCKPTSAPSMIPTVNPSAVPTAMPTSRKPSAAPTAKPSSLPSMAPTYVLYDCRSSCQLFYNGTSGVAIGAGKKLGDVKLPYNFRLQFDVYTATTPGAGETLNVIQFYDDYGAVPYLDISMNQDGYALVWFSGTGYPDISVSMMPPTDSDYATVFLTYENSMLSAFSTAMPNLNAAGLGFAMVSFPPLESLAARTMSLYASAPNNLGTTVGGRIRNLIVEGKCVSASLLQRDMCLLCAYATTLFRADTRVFPGARCSAHLLSHAGTNRRTHHGAYAATLH
jgi:hypothetical protein